MGLHFFFLGLYLALSNFVDPVFLFALLIVHCVLKLITDANDGRRGVYVMTTFYIGVIITTFANLFFISKVTKYGLGEFSMYYYISLEHVQEAGKVWALGNTFIFIGYELFSKKSFPNITIDFRTPKAIRNLYNFILFFSLLSLSGNVIRLSFITGGLQKVLSLLNIMGILFFARLWVKENNNKYRNYAIFLCVLQTIIALLTSFLRVELLTPTISLFGGYFIAKGKLKYLFSYRVIMPLLILTVFSLFFRTLAGNRSHFITAFTDPRDDRFDMEETGYVYVSPNGGEEGGLLERNANIAQLSNVVKLVEKNGMYGGKASAPLIAAFIPRFLWPDKPKVQLGAWFAVEIGVATIGENGKANNSINMSVPGELYLDFGWIGLILGCISFGGLVAMFWNAAKFNESPYNLSGALWGGYLLLYALAGIGADLQIVVSLISTYLVFYIIKRIIKHYAGVIGGAVVAG